MNKSNDAAISLPNVVIVILNWNGWKDTLKCLEDVNQLNYPNYRTVIVDNGSEDDSWQKLTAIEGVRSLTWPANHSTRLGDEREIEPENSGNCKPHDNSSNQSKNVQESVPAQGTVLIGTNANLGFAGGCNVGIDYALSHNADYVFLLNNDAQIAPHAMSHLIDVAKRADAAIVGAKVLDEYGRSILFSINNWPEHLFGGTNLATPEREEAYWPSPGGVDGAAILLRRDLLERRLEECRFALDPQFFMYAEETDLCLYGYSKGYRCVVARDAVVCHGLSKSSGGAGNPRSYYYLTRNRIYLANRWLSLPWKILFHLYYIPSRLALRLLRVRKVGDGSARAVFNGLLDGYRGKKGKWQRHGRWHG